MEQISAIAAKTQSTAMKISTTVTETKSVEKEITLPYYFKIGHDLSKVISKTHFITIDTDNDWWAIKVRPVNAYKGDIAKGEPITEEEYNQAFEKAKMYVELLNSDEPIDNSQDENVQIDEMLYGQAI